VRRREAEGKREAGDGDASLAQSCTELTLLWLVELLAAHARGGGQNCNIKSPMPSLSPALRNEIYREEYRDLGW